MTVITAMFAEVMVLGLPTSVITVIELIFYLECNNDIGVVNGVTSYYATL